MGSRYAIWSAAGGLNALGEQKLKRFLEETEEKGDAQFFRFFANSLPLPPLIKKGEEQNNEKKEVEK